MFETLLAAIVLAADSSHAHADSARVVRQFPAVVVTADRASDPGSIESVRSLPGSRLVRMPVDRLADAIALQAGVVATGEDLHVRGGRAGELAVSTLGVPLADPMRGTPMEVPLFAVESADLMLGALDADHAGALAGELDLQTIVPTRTPAWLARWTSDGRRYGGSDVAHARLTAPLARTGLGLALAGEARLDDHGLPSARTPDPTHVLGGTFGWRHDNHLLGWLELAPLDHPHARSLQYLDTRVRTEPWNPMFTFDGWVTIPTPEGGQLQPPVLLTSAPVDSSSKRYRAADHVVMSDVRRQALIATTTAGGDRIPVRATAAWLRDAELTGVGLRPTPGQIDDATSVVFGAYRDSITDPFHAILGDEPYFRSATSERWLGRLEAAAVPARGQRLRAGAMLTHDAVSLFEVDAARPLTPGVDSLRSFRARASGGAAFVQHRWESGGMVWNGGLRLQAFDAGPQAAGHHVVWTLSPRMGFAIPVSTRDVFAVAYARIHQDPARELLYESRLRGYARSPLGNGALEPSEVLTWQAALKHVLDPRWQLQLAVFARDVYGEPGVQQVPAPYGVELLQYANADDAHAAGFELTLSHTGAPGDHAELAYTFQNAYGSLSSASGFAFGNAFGDRPLPTGTTPLDWDVRHAVTLQVERHIGASARLSWATRVATGLPWTPLARTALNAADSLPPLVSDLGELNLARLPWSEATNVAVRWQPRWLRGATAILSVTNLFDHVDDRLVTIDGWPNPSIGTRYDEYTAYRTDTGQGGGAWWGDADADHVGEWHAVHDPRLAAPRRAIRLGIELGR